METDAYIALGSNMGDRELNLLRAVAELGRLSGCRVTALSGFYETSPVGMPDGTETFFNGVLRLATTLAPEALLKEMLHIERDIFGRVHSAMPTSRRMDLDLLMFGDAVLEIPGLTLPHPRMRERLFVLRPLAEIASGLKEPVTGKTIAELLGELKSEEQVSLLGE